MRGTGAPLAEPAFLPSIPARDPKKRLQILHFLSGEGILEEVEAAAIKRAVALKSIDLMREDDVPIIQMARQM